MMGRMTTDDGTDGWKGRPNTTASGQNQGYYISRYISEHIKGGRHIGVAVIFGGKRVCNTHYQYPTFNCLIYLFDDPKHVTKKFHSLTSCNVEMPRKLVRYIQG
jgi:hypothetical protein